MVHTHLKKFSSAKLWIAGDGPLRQEMTQWVTERNLNEFIQFLGYRRDIDELIDSAAIMVVPSYVEGFGLVLLEAMSRKTPLIATNISAIPSLD